MPRTTSRTTNGKASRTAALPLAAYVRVSHVGGREGDAFRSPEDQRAAMAAWAEREGVALVQYPDELDVSGGKVSRPVLDSIREAMDRGEVGGIVVAYGSRLFRNAGALLALLDWMDERGLRYVDVATSGMDTSTPEGRMARTVLASMDEMVLAQHSARFAALRADVVAAGRWQQPKVPRGYALGEGRRLVPDDDADVVRQAFAMRAGGASTPEVGRFLGLTPSGARRLMANRVYLGEIRNGENVNPNAHEPLVEPGMFAAVQATWQGPRVTTGRGRSPLAGLVRCASCGHVMPRSASRRSAGGAVYRCAYPDCPRHAAISAGPLEDYVAAVALPALAAVEAEAADKGTDRADAEAALAAARAEVAAFVATTSAADLGPDLWREGLAVRQQAVADAEADVVKATRPEVGQVENAAEVWPDLSAPERAAVLGGLLATIVVAPVGRGQRVPVAERVTCWRRGAEDLPPLIRRRNGGIRAGVQPLPHDPANVDALRVPTV